MSSSSSLLASTSIQINEEKALESEEVIMEMETTTQMTTTKANPVSSTNELKLPIGGTEHTSPVSINNNKTPNSMSTDGYSVAQTNLAQQQMVPQDKKQLMNQASGDDAPVTVGQIKHIVRDIVKELIEDFRDDLYNNNIRFKGEMFREFLWLKVRINFK
jgi:hypothetical protein